MNRWSCPSSSLRTLCRFTAIASTHSQSTWESSIRVCIQPRNLDYTSILRYGSCYSQEPQLILHNTLQRLHVRYHRSRVTHHPRSHQPRRWLLPDHHNSRKTTLTRSLLSRRVLQSGDLLQHSQGMWIIYCKCDSGGSIGVRQVHHHQQIRCHSAGTHLSARLRSTRWRVFLKKHMQHGSKEGVRRHIASAHEIWWLRGSLLNHQSQSSNVD